MIRPAGGAIFRGNKGLSEVVRIFMIRTENELLD